MLPVAIRGSYAIMPKAGTRIHGGLIEVTILPAIDSAGMKTADIHPLMNQIHERIDAALGATA